MKLRCWRGRGTTSSYYHTKEATSEESGVRGGFRTAMKDALLFHGFSNSLQVVTAYIFMKRGSVLSSVSCNSRSSCLPGARDVRFLPKAHARHPRPPK